MKIYVVTKGRYDDYRIVAATIDKDRAEYLRDIADTQGYSHDDDDESRIEEYDDYYGETFVDGRAYCITVTFDYYGKHYRPTVNVCNNRSEIFGKELLTEEALKGKIELQKTDNRLYYEVYVVTTSEEKALKKGLDMIYKHMEEELGIKVEE